MMGQHALISDECPPENLSPELPPAPVADDEDFPQDPWDEELAELVLDLEAATLEPTSSAIPPPSIDFDNATPREVLGRVLGLISSPSSRHYERYGEFATKDTEGLSGLLASCLRPEVATLVGSHDTSSVTQYAQFLTVMLRNLTPTQSSLPWR